MIQYIYKNKKELEIETLKDVDEFLEAVLDFSSCFKDHLKKSVNGLYLELPTLYVGETRKPIYLKALNILGLEFRIEENKILYR